WAIENGVRSEDRFCAWIIATAKVAGEIANDLGLINFNTNIPCLKAIEAVKAQTREIKTSNQLVDELITEFINAHNGCFTTYTNNRYANWSDTPLRGEIVGRITTENQITIIAISRKAFSNWARERGVDTQQISQYASQNCIEEKPVKLVQNGKATRCLLIPINESDEKNLLMEILENPREQRT
ncbi:MAG: hypothetical protein HC846_07160, partial [Blastocatellia bacterium]|nr:hypothetical protein [Blastocatellia bacterium]